jgi:hypothetical protein
MSNNVTWRCNISAGLNNSKAKGIWLTADSFHGYVGQVNNKVDLFSHGLASGFKVK